MWVSDPLHLELLVFEHLNMEFFPLGLIFVNKETNYLPIYDI